MNFKNRIFINNYDRNSKYLDILNNIFQENNNKIKALLSTYLSRVEIYILLKGWCKEFLYSSFN